MNLLELIAQLQDVLAQHPDLAEQELSNAEGGEVYVEVLPADRTERISAQGTPYRHRKTLVVG